MIKTAIIGCGRMGRRHIQAIQNLQYDIVGVVDPFEESLKAAQDENNIKLSQCFRNIEELFLATKPELVIIATTADSHFDYTIECSQQSSVKFILCEKPMATSISHCKQMIQACKDKYIKLAINHPVRFTEADIKIKELVNSDKFGGLNVINVSAGNFGLAMNATHNLEMFRFLTNKLPTKVTAWFDDKTIPNPRGPQFIDRSGCIKVLNDDGQQLIINAGNKSGHGIIITYNCRNGQIALNPLTSSAMVTVRKAEFSDRPTTQYALPAENYIEDFKSSDLIIRCEKMVNALLNNKDYPDGDTIIRTVEIIAGAYVSNENNNKEINIKKDKLDINRTFPWA